MSRLATDPNRLAYENRLVFYNCREDLNIVKVKSVLLQSRQQEDRSDECCECGLVYDFRWKILVLFAFGLFYFVFFCQPKKCADVHSMTCYNNYNRPVRQ